MKKLFVVLLGGKHPRASIEVHDIVIATAETLTDTYPQLREHWYGVQDGLHIDAWLQVSGFDGYQLKFCDSAPAEGEPRLYLINLGGYYPEEFGEAHRYFLVTATSRTEAKIKGKRQYDANWAKPHTDAVVDVDDCLPLDFVNGAHIQLVPGEHAAPYFENDYILLNR
jgi:hypothetical protein